MPTEIGVDYSEEVCRAFEEEISYEQHIENMDRIRDERRDRIYPTPPRDRRISHPNDTRVTATDVRDSWTVYSEPEFDEEPLEPEKPKKNLIGGKLL